MINGTTLYLPLNLQHFNDNEEIEVDLAEHGFDEEEIEEFETIEDAGVEIPEHDDDEGEEADEVEQEEETEVTEDKPKPAPNQTANAVIAERRKWQAKQKELEAKAKLADRLMKQAGVDDPEALAKRLDEIESQRLQEQGVPPELADRIARQERELAEQRHFLRTAKYEVEAEKLKSDPFYADLDEHYDDLVEFADKMQISLEDAYSVKHGRRRMKERELEIQERVKQERAKKQAKKVDTSVSGASTQAAKRVTLTKEQRAVARAAGIDEQEYAKYIKKK